LANFFYKEAESKYFRLCRLSQNQWCYMSTYIRKKISICKFLLIEFYW
jgi:hypothetical protein